MPHDVVLKLMNGAHRGLLKVTGGRVGRQVAGMPVLELTTVGRKSGQKRSVMLTAPCTTATRWWWSPRAAGTTTTPRGS